MARNRRIHQFWLLFNIEKFLLKFQTKLSRLKNGANHLDKDFEGEVLSNEKTLLK